MKFEQLPFATGRMLVPGLLLHLHRYIYFLLGPFIMVSLQIYRCLELEVKTQDLLASCKNWTGTRALNLRKMEPLIHALVGKIGTKNSNCYISTPYV